MRNVILASEKPMSAFPTPYALRTSPFSSLRIGYFQIGLVTTRSLVKNAWAHRQLVLLHESLLFFDRVT